MSNAKRRRLAKDAAKAVRGAGNDPLHFDQMMAQVRRGQLGFGNRKEARSTGRRGKERYVAGMGFFR